MKKKGPRSIPDFSRTRKEKPGTEVANAKPAPPPARDRVIKPKATSSKGGRRGS